MSGDDWIVTAVSVPEMLCVISEAAEWPSSGKATHTIFHICFSLFLSSFCFKHGSLERLELSSPSIRQGLSPVVCSYYYYYSTRNTMNNMSTPPIPIIAASALTLLPWSASTTWTFAVNASVNMPTTLVSTRYSTMGNGLFLYITRHWLFLLCFHLVPLNGHCIIETRHHHHHHSSILKKMHWYVSQKPMSG